MVPTQLILLPCTIITKRTDVQAADNPSVGNRAEKQCLKENGVLSLITSGLLLYLPGSLFAFVSFLSFPFKGGSCMLNEPVICWILVQSSYGPMKAMTNLISFWATETDAYLSRLHGLRTGLHPHPGMAEDPYHP
ncbi:uncharacterized protein BDW43DRAFT_292191 [Aspergillus alliaceus]|uniref:uncharacterized protein n=1 Tax=Petromyces alliaceus TaxID=209559 RepID=UPI0012A3E3AD|nr:uncharacterized protein BDW43DRAFT_292191 [Aspergillus alliaceus]KAB8228095.1 hypothetical protein BDW43DRAFT_292191 [Aspergillus alliaceus]